MKLQIKLLSRRHFLKISGMFITVATVGAVYLKFGMSRKKLAPEIFNRLWALFLLIGREWGLLTEEDVINRREIFEGFINARILHSPSYFEIYENYERNSDFRRIIVREFAELHLISGGFRKFGYKNYFGHPGGPLTSHPYR